MVPILLQRKICIEMISKTKRNPVISAKAQNFAQPLGVEEDNTFLISDATISKASHDN